MASEIVDLNCMIRQYYARCLEVILESRVPSFSANCRGSIDSKSLASRPGAKGNCFNLVLGRSGPAFENLEPWCRSIHEPMFIDVFLAQSKESTKDILFPADGPSQQAHIKGKGKMKILDTGFPVSSPQHTVLLERWTVQCTAPEVGTWESQKAKGLVSRGWTPVKAAGKPRSRLDVSAVHKRAVIMLRSLYSMARLLPAHSLFRLTGSSSRLKSRLACEVSASVSPLSDHEKNNMGHYSFTPIESLCGQMCLSVSYLQSIPSAAFETASPVLPMIIPDYVGSHLSQPLKQLNKKGFTHSPVILSEGQVAGAKKSCAIRPQNNGTAALEHGHFNQLDELECPFALTGDYYRKESSVLRPFHFDGKKGIFSHWRSEDAAVGTLIRLFQSAAPLRSTQVHSNLVQGPLYVDCTNENVILPLSSKCEKAVKVSQDGPSLQTFTKTSSEAKRELKLYIDIRNSLCRYSALTTKTMI